MKDTTTKARPGVADDEYEAAQAVVAARAEQDAQAEAERRAERRASGLVELDDNEGSRNPYKVQLPDGSFAIVSDDPDDVYGNPDDFPAGTKRVTGVL